MHGECSLPGGQLKRECTSYKVSVTGQLLRDECTRQVDRVAKGHAWPRRQLEGDCT